MGRRHDLGRLRRIIPDLYGQVGLPLVQAARETTHTALRERILGFRVDIGDDSALLSWVAVSNDRSV
jgi:hypothetical protein